MRIASEQILGIVTAQLPPGAPLSAVALDRALLLADDLPGVGVRGRLVEGRGERETALALSVSDEPLISGDVGVDSTGSRSTGSNRLAVNLALNSPAGIGDQATANAIHTQGSDYVRLGYSLPVGSDGWRVGVNISELRYRLIVAPFNADTDRGHSSSTGLDVSYPLLRSRLANLYTSLAYDHKTIDNQFAGATSTRYKLDNVTVSLAGNLFDNLGGGGANSGSLAFTSGTRRNQIGTTDQNFTKLR